MSSDEGNSASTTGSSDDLYRSADEVELPLSTSELVLHESNDGSGLSNSYVSSDDSASSFDTSSNDSSSYLYSSSEDEDDDDDSNSDFEYEDDGGYIHYIPTEVINLEEIATFSVAFQFWTVACVDIPKMIVEDLEWKESLLKRIFQSIENLSLPQRLQSRVKQHIVDIISNTRILVKYDFGRVFSGRKKCDLFRYVDNIAWYLNGAINDEKTARNLLKCDGLSDVEKFKVACLYCLREEVEERWPLLPLSVQNDLFEPSRNPCLIYYWSHFCAGKLDELTYPYDSLDESMIRERDVDVWPAIEYFFDGLDVNAQVNSAIWLCSRGDTHHLELILLKLNKIQRLTVYQACAVKMITSYVLDSDHEEDKAEQKAISNWYEVRGFIDQVEFVSMFKDLMKWNPKDNVLTEIWTSSSDDFKSKILNLEEYDFVKQVLHGAALEKRLGFEFVFAVLSDRTRLSTKQEINMAERKSYHTLCSKLIEGDDFESLSRLLNLGIPSTEERSEFKLQFLKKKFFKEYVLSLKDRKGMETLQQLFNVFHPEFKNVARDLLLEIFEKIDDQYSAGYLAGNLTPLNDLLVPFKSSYSDVIQEYKQKLIFSISGIETCANYLYSSASTGTLDDILKDSGLSGIKIMNKFRRSLIFSSNGIEKLHNIILSGNEKRLKNAKKILDQDLKCNKDKKKLKRRLLGRFEEMKTDCNSVKKKNYSMKLSRLC